MLSDLAEQIVVMSAICTRVPVNTTHATVANKLIFPSHHSFSFCSLQSVADVYEWVFSLDNMPDLPPGSWCLSATFPNQKILPAGSIWSPGGCSADGSELQQYILELQLTGSAAGGADSWGLSVRQITGEELLVLVGTLYDHITASD